jgi:uncharacterized membrane protein YqjE
MHDPQTSGLFGSVRQLMATALEMVQVRIELIGTELEFEKRRLFDGFLCAAIAMVFLGVGVLLLCSTIIWMFWEGYRLAAMGVMAVLCLGVAGVLLMQARKRLHNPLSMFHASTSELERDKESLQSSKSHG